MTDIDSPASTAAVAPAQVLASRRLTLLDTIQGHANNYTLIRLLLASSVIWYHSFGMTFDQGHPDRITDALYPITTVGGLAVQCFFFLSGLFVALSYYRDQSTVGFVIKRTLRIWPGLFVCVAVTALAACIASQGSDAWRYLLQPDFHDYITANSRLKLTWEIPGIFETNRSYTINGPIHTLPLEVKMYLLLGVLGLLGLVRGRTRLLLASALLLAVVLIRPVVFTEPFDVIDYGQAPIAMFFAGVILFCVADRVRVAAWQALPLAALFWLSTGPLHTIAFYLLAIWIMLWLGQWQPLVRAFRPKQDPSYGIYIYGWPCQQLVLLAKPDLNPYWLMAIALALAWLCALLSWHWVEKPAIEFGRLLTRRWKARRDDSPLRKPWPTGWKLIAGLLLLLLAIKAASFVAHRIDFLPVERMTTRIVDFGPHESRVGEPMNQLPDGSSAIWLSLDSTPDAATRVVFDGVALDTAVGDKLITANVPAYLLMSRGDKTIKLERRHLDRIERSNSVTLRITR